MSAGLFVPYRRSVSLSSLGTPLVGSMRRTTTILQPEHADGCLRENSRLSATLVPILLIAGFA